jgi:hypothetical protein
MPKEAGPENPSIAAPTEAPGQKSCTKESRSLGELNMSSTCRIGQVTKIRRKSIENLIARPPGAKTSHT